jgi:chromosome segregation ATPase
MGIDELPQQFDALVDAARVALHGEITSARAIVERSNAEKAAAQGALAELQGQLKQVQAELDRSRKYLDRASSLAGLDSEIEKARRELERLKQQKAEETKALEKVSKERTECQAKINALAGEVGQLVAQRAYSQEVMAKVKHQLAELGV